MPTTKPIKEDLLHFIWKYRKLKPEGLRGSKNESIVVIDTGTHNFLAGPDFFNAKIKIDGQLWAGNVEIHLKSSDWFAHDHEQDDNYNNVILHVVWEDDGAVFRSDNTEIPTLELCNFIPSRLLTAYEQLFDKSGIHFINCENDIADIDKFLLENWLERLYFERLERKSLLVLELLKQSKNNWEQVLFALMLKNFGLKINGESFLSLALALDFSTVRKVRSDAAALESVFFGMSHLLDDDQIFDDYYIRLRENYTYYHNKFDLRNEGVIKPEFFKLRPPNFPTIRLSQLAVLYSERENLFSAVIHTSNLKEIYTLFEVSATPYWNEHFTFGKKSKRSVKRLTKNFIDLLIINTLIPLKFCYAKHMGRDADQEIILLISQLKKEGNSIVTNFKRHGVAAENAMHSQAILQLYNEYCSQNKCLQCAVGSRLLQS